MGRVIMTYSSLNTTAKPMSPSAYWSRVEHRHLQSDRSPVRPTIFFRFFVCVQRLNESVLWLALYWSFIRDYISTYSVKTALWTSLWAWETGQIADRLADLETQRFLQRVSIACYAECCISYDRFCLTVWPSVCHTLVSCQNDSSYDHGVFTGG